MESDPRRGLYQRARRPVLALLGLLSVGLVVASAISSQGGSERPEIPLQAVLDMFPGAAQATAEGGRVMVTDPSGALIGAAFNTRDVPPAVRGYSGEIDVLVGVTPEGRIAGAVVLAHRETPYYFSMIDAEGFPARFADLTPADAADIDAVSGATVTSLAIRNDVAHGAARVAEELWGVELPEDLPTLSDVEANPLHVALALAAGTAGLLVHFTARRRGWARNLMWLFSIGVVGFWINAAVSVADVFRIAALDIPTISPSWILLAFALVSAPLLGRVYCGYVCPFGAMQEIVFRLAPGKWAVSPKVARVLGDVRYLVLFTLVILVFGLDRRTFATFEPYATFFSLTGGILIWAYTLATLFFSAHVRRFWCRFLCPTGACLDGLAALRIRRGMRLDEDEEES